MRVVYLLLLTSAFLLGPNAQTEWKSDLQKAAGVAKVLYQYLRYAANNIDGDGENSKALHDFEESEENEYEDDEDEDGEDEEDDDDEAEAEDDEIVEEAGDVTEGERRK